MNVLKKLPYIAIIFFVIVSYVCADKCTNEGGHCMSRERCIGTIKEGICKENSICCVPEKPVEQVKQNDNKDLIDNKKQNDNQDLIDNKKQNDNQDLI